MICGVIVQATRTFNSLLLAGVLHYAQREPSFRVRTFRFSDGEDLVSSLRGVRCDGWILGDLMAGHLKAGFAVEGLAVLQSFVWERDWEFPQLAFPNREIGARAAMHLLSQGVESYLFVGARASRSSPRRWEGFSGALASEGREAHFFQDGPSQRGQAVIQVDIQERDLMETIQMMPKPLGIFASDDRHGEKVIDIAGKAGFSIPEEVAVVCVSSTPFLCEYCAPPLSAFHLDHYGQGELAAEWIFRAWKKGGIHEPPPFAPFRFIRRLSSCHLERKDPLVKKALLLMEDNLGAGLSVEELTGSLPVAKRTLERRFQRVMGQSPAACLRDIRIRKTVEALSQGGHSIKAIGFDYGWADISHMSRTIKKATGLTPGEWQRKHHFPDGYLL